MATHVVTDPEGREHEIEGPDNATPEQVIAQAQRLIGPTRAGQRGLPPEPGAPAASAQGPTRPGANDPGNYGQRAIEPGSWDETANEAGKTLLPLLAGSGVGGLAGKGVSMAAKGAAPRLLPALGRVLGTGAVGGIQTPGDTTDKLYGGLKAAGSAGAAEAALPLAVAGSRALKLIRGLMQGEGPGVTNVHIKSAPPVPEPSLVQLPDQIAQARNLGTARQAVGAPAQPPPPGIPDPHDPALNIVDVIRSRYGLAAPKGPSVPAAVQTAADAGAGTETGQNVSGLATLGLVDRLLKHARFGPSRDPNFTSHTGG